MYRLKTYLKFNCQCNWSVNSQSWGRLSAGWSVKGPEEGIWIRTEEGLCRRGVLSVGVLRTFSES